MNSRLAIQLDTTPEQRDRLRALQAEFAEACNAISPVAREHRCWNRVALHHMTYRLLRERFPQLGSQMACNAIYSVCRACRLVYQSPGSPFNLARLAPGARLPLVSFAPTAPVYFDRHTLSLKNGRLSMFTLDGRLRFDLGLSPEDEQRFHASRLLEIILAARGEGYSLTFTFGVGEPLAALATDTPADTLQAAPYASGIDGLPAGAGSDLALPAFLSVARETPAAPPPATASP